MNPFEQQESTPYQRLRIQKFGEEAFVGINDLLDILTQRAMMCLRTCGQPTEEAHIKGFLSGRFYEMQELYEALNATQPK